MSVEKASPLFGDITVYPPDAGKQRVEVYLRLQKRVEEMYIGIAIDGSASMQESFGDHIPTMVRRAADNKMQPVVRRLCSYACKFSSDGTVLPIYWAVGPGGKEIESMQRLNEDASENLSVNGPVKKTWGTGTLLLPPLEFFLQEYVFAPWTVLLFITDGVIGDLDAVIAKSLSVGQEIVEGTRGKCKFIIVGYGPEVNETQIEQLDNMFNRTALQDQIDLWDGKLADDMDGLTAIWDEVDFGISIPGNVRITDDSGNIFLSESDHIPQRMEFRVPEGTKSVTIEIFGETIVQTLQ